MKYQILKTFKSWCNFHLKSQNTQIESIDEDFKDGTKLIDLLESQTGEILPRVQAVKMRSHKIANVDIVLNYIENMGVNNVSIVSEDIVDGDLKKTLELIWSIILKFSIKNIYFEGFQLSNN